MKIILYLLLFAALGLLLYIRLAPHDVERWHRMPDDPQDRDMEGGAIRVLTGQPADALARLDNIAMDEPLTMRLAGSVEEGMITYVSRSKWFGFPDYTTVRQQGDRLAMHARLRFGKGDMGVNRKRLERWIAALESGS